MTIIPVILSGGVGTRLWPLSRSQYPKQFLPLISSHTMIQETLLRLKNVKVASPIVVCNESHRFVVVNQLEQINIKDATIILEPVGKNIAPATTVAAFHGLTIDKDAILIVLPSDHVIKNTEALTDVLSLAWERAENGFFVTFGIKPTEAETGYGYLKIRPKNKEKVFHLEEFIEKPNLKTAKKFLRNGDYFWNSGMFVFKAQTYLSELENYNKQIFDTVKKAYDGATIDNNFIHLDKNAFSKSPSVDYAVMRHTDKGKVIILDAGWSDVGSWSALWEVKSKDKNNNVVTGDVVICDTTDSYIYGQSRLVTGVGLKDTIIVETSDAVLVADKNHVQSVKTIVEKLKEQKRLTVGEYKNGLRDWGQYNAIERGKNYQIKHITVKPFVKLSVEMYPTQAETWIVVSGKAHVKVKGKEKVLNVNDSIFVTGGTNPQLENLTKDFLELLVIQCGEYPKEEDIVRFEDRYTSY